MNPAVMSAVKRKQRGPVLLKLAAGTDPRAAGFTYSGDANSWYADANGLFHNAPNATPRYSAYVRDNLGAWRRVILLEPLRKNVILNSAVIPVSGNAWGDGSADWAVATVPSILSGQLAYKHTNLGTNVFRARNQMIGALTGSAETLSVIMENVNAVTTRIGLRDATAGAFVIAVDFTWATHTAAVVAGAGTVKVVDLLNGRYRIFLTGTGTAGNARQSTIYVTGVDQNTNAAIIHHVQHEEAAFGTSPIVSGAAAVTRAAQYMSIAWPYPVQPMSVYESFVELGTLISLSSNSAYLSFGTPGVTPALIRYNRTKQEGWAFYGAALTTGGNVPDPQPVIGDSVEVCTVFRRQGMQAEGRISMSNNGAAETPQNIVLIADAAFANASPWSAPGKFTINGNGGGGLIGSVGYSEVIVATGDHDMLYLRSL